VRKYAFLIVLLALGLTLTGFAPPLVTVAEEDGNPWWIWLVVFGALVIFVIAVLWWWMSSHREEEEFTFGAEPEPPAKIKVSGPLPPDDLKRIEGIGPKISSVLQAAGIATFAQLAATDVGRLRQILEEENPNLLRLADPTTWPDQARLAADGAWEALEKLQDELKGGRRP
jgi:predicted flap endonuclease-1-like 5' DNA nuclease